MAISLQSANLVRQKAYNAVYGTGTSSRAVSPYHFYAVKSLFLHLAANKGNPDLQFIPFTASQIIANGGYSPDVDACNVYAFFGRARRTSGTTSSFIALHDATDNSATTTTTETALINAAGQSFMFIYPDGRPHATELTVSAATAVGGATESSATDAVDGFVIIGS